MVYIVVSMVNGTFGLTIDLIDTSVPTSPGRVIRSTHKVRKTM